MGDCNIRWHGRYDHESDILGPKISGQGLTYLESHDHENREQGMNFLRARSLFF